MIKQIHKHTLLLVIMMLLQVQYAYSMSGGVSGKVVDNKGTALIGVTVLIKGTMVGTSTDLNGEYTIKADDKSTLTFSYIGYATDEVVVGMQTVINATLTEESEAIGSVEVVSIGYGTSTRRDLTGSVVKADMDNIMKSNVTTFDKALTGRIAGVVVTTGDGALGQDANITIRGNNSLTQSSAPLYVIDGFPSESSFATSLNPADIASMVVLKDASSTAIYGARGANGVIVITTKQGVAGLPKVNFTTSFTYNDIANKIDLMNPYDYVSLQVEMDEDTKFLDDDRTIDTFASVDGYDWQDEVYRGAFTQNYNLSISGGTTSGVRYNVAFSALDQDGIILNSNFQRYQGKVNFIIPVNKKLSFSVNANYSNALTNGLTPTDSHTTSSSSGWLIYSVWGYQPISSDPNADLLNSLVDNADGDIDTTNDYRFNPIKTVQNEYRRTIVDYFNANGALTYTILPDLSFKSSVGYTLNKRRQEAFNNSETYTGYAGSSSGKGVNGSIQWTNQRTWLNENTLTWKKRVNHTHNMDFLAGITFQGSEGTIDGISSTQITSEELGIAGIHTGEQQISPQTYNDWSMMSGLFRFNYNYLYKYYLTTSFRADGSSKFPTDNRWGYFPSVGASWNFNREDLLKGKDWLSNGKLRASWGLTGNNRTKTPYDYYSQITVSPGNSDSYDYVFDGMRVPGYYTSNLENQDLKWETTEQYNVGVDLGFFDSRISVTADWYMKNTRDLLLFAPLPTSSGFTVATMNIGEIQNKGVELSVQTVNIKTSNFQWTSSFNIGFNRNKITSLTDGQQNLFTSVGWDNKFNSQIPYVSTVGMPTGMMYGYIYEGTYKDDDFNGSTLKQGEAYLSTLDRNEIRPGDPKYKDLNGDGFIDSNDQTIIGCGQPLHTGGFENTFTYKNLDLNIFMSWSYGNDILNANRLIFESGMKLNTNQLTSYANRWTETNRSSDIPRAKSIGSDVYSSRVIEDGSYLRIGNISLGYTVNSSALKRININALRVYVSVDNIYTFSDYSGPDPEVSTRNSVLTPGFDWSAYPRTMGFTVGANLTF